jgi:hypothetical protein
MTRFGDIISADRLEDDLTIFLKKWIGTYLAEVADYHGDSRTDYPAPKYWTTTPILTVDTVTQVRYPAALVVSPGLMQKPVRRGDGTYEGSYQIGVCILTSVKSELGSSRMARRYGAAVHAAVMQRPSLDTTYIEGVEWADERFTDFLNAEQDTVASATEIFNVTVKGLFNALKGPGVADPLPEPATYPELTEVRDPDTAPPFSPVPPSVEPLP